MRLTRSLSTRLSLTLATSAGVMSILAFAGALSCSKYSTYKDVPIDCTVLGQYEIGTQDDHGLIDAFKDFASADDGWFSVADVTNTATSTSTSVQTSTATSTGGNYTASSTFTFETVPSGLLCGNTSAIVFHASHNDDWGGMFGKYDFDGVATKGRDASMWEGVSFWARAPGNTTKAFTFVFDDDNTFAVDKDKEATSGTRCRSYPTDGGAPGQQSSGNSTVQTDPGTGTPITGSSNSRASYPDECGNSFTFPFEVTGDWAFYTIAFRQFQQTASPNRVPNEVFTSDAGVDTGVSLKTSGLRSLAIRMPKEAEVELWMANLAFYRPKAQ